jgi:3'-5' exoribonuclease
MSQYLVQSVSKAQTKRGKNYLRMQLVEAGGKVHRGVMWEDKDLDQGCVIDALVEEDSFGGEAQLNVKALRVIAAKPTGDEFLPRATVDVGTLMTELKGFIASVADDGIKRVLYRAVEDPRWFRWPAAQGMHHAYLGGLLEHTTNLARLADAIARLYPIVRRDLLIAAAVLHDVGKLDEMRCDTNIEYVDEGKLLGHIIQGYERLMVWCAEEVLDPPTALLLKHLVLSHHGQQSFGSPKSPQLLEAQIFSNMDGLDANIGSMLAKIKEAQGKAWTEKCSTGQALYLGEMKK